MRDPFVKSSQAGEGFDFLQDYAEALFKNYKEFLADLNMYHQASIPDQEKLGYKIGFLFTIRSVLQSLEALQDQVRHKLDPKDIKTIDQDPTATLKGMIGRCVEFLTEGEMVETLNQLIAQEFPRIDISCASKYYAEGAEEAGKYLLDSLSEQRPDNKPSPEGRNFRPRHLN